MRYKVKNLQKTQNFYMFFKIFQSFFADSVECAEANGDAKGEFGGQ